MAKRKRFDVWVVISGHDRQPFVELGMYMVCRTRAAARNAAISGERIVKAELRLKDAS